MIKKDKLMIRGRWFIAYFSDKNIKSEELTEIRQQETADLWGVGINQIEEEK